jgi:LEA14-like dessication related protein
MKQISMNGFTKLLLLAGAGLGIYYIPTILALKSLNIKLISAYPVAIKETRIDAVVGVQLTNNSNTNLRIQSIKADVILNGLKIAQFSQTENFTILPKLNQKFNVYFTVDAEIIGTEIFRQLILNNLQNSVLQVKGSLVANNKALPVDTYFTIKDFTA